MKTALLVVVQHFGGALTPQELRDYVDQTLDAVDKEVSVLWTLPSADEVRAFDSGRGTGRRRGEATMNAARLWRAGCKVGRTIYEQVGDEPSDDDRLIGTMDTPELARSVVAAREVHVKLFAGAAEQAAEPSKPDDPMRLA